MSDSESPPYPEFVPTRLQRRLIDAAVEIQDCCPDTPAFQHAVLCQVGLPRSRRVERFFSRSCGNSSVAIEAGKIWRGSKKGWVEVPMPYGAKPRLVLMHICREAIRTRHPEIEVGQSAREFLGKLGLDTSGHEYARFRGQMEALAACRMLIGMETGTYSVQINTQPISRFEAWTQHDNKSLGLWPGSMTLSADFFATLLDHAVPLNEAAIHALRKSALALDVYTWLAHRLCRIRKTGGVKLSWRNLKDQFRQEYRTPRDFKKEFRAALFKVHAVYPTALLIATAHSAVQGRRTAAKSLTYSAAMGVTMWYLLVYR